MNTFDRHDSTYQIPNNNKMHNKHPLISSKHRQRHLPCCHHSTAHHSTPHSYSLTTHPSHNTLRSLGTAPHHAPHHTQHRNIASGTTQPPSVAIMSRIQSTLHSNVHILVSLIHNTHNDVFQGIKPRGSVPQDPRYNGGLTTTSPPSLQQYKYTPHIPSTVATCPLHQRLVTDGGCLHDPITPAIRCPLC